MKKILVVYYSQTGQIKDIVDSVISGFDNNDKIQTEFFKIMPVNDYPFPWPSDRFFDSMPESVKGIPTLLDMSGFPKDEHFDLVILAGQVWYLSPSIPLNSFLLTQEATDFLKGKNVITLYGVRNMWIMAQEKIKSLLHAMDAHLVGNIVLIDKAVNSVSVLTIIKWLMKGNKGPYRFLPEAGVSSKEIANAERFAKPIMHALLSDDFSLLQAQLLQTEALNIQYHVMCIERTAIKIFTKFAGFILAKGKEGNKKRMHRVKLFKFYLLAVIFIVFPIAALFFKIKKILYRKNAREDMDYYKNITIVRLKQ